MNLGLRHTAVAILLLPALGFGQGLEKVKELYTKYEYRIPMRDGKRMFTSVYVPKDDSEPAPILMSRTPYSVAPYGVDKYKTEVGPSVEFGNLGKYIIVYQDVRGRNMSEGEFINMTPHKPNKKGPADVDESSDTYDTIDWLVKNIPNNNGRVGTWGISYPGFYTAAGMIDAHPAHKAASPQAPITDWFTGDDFHRNGALYLPHAFNFLVGFGKPRPEPIVPKRGETFDHGTPDGYKFFLNLGPLYNANEKYYKNEISFWNDMMKHGTYDEFWQSRNLRPHLKAIKPAVMTVGGWFDAENLYGAMNVYRNVEKTSQTQNILVMGPWRHGGWARDAGDKLGDVSFNSKTSEYYRKNIELKFFEFHLRSKGENKLPEAYMFETGTNVWRKYDSWPPKETKESSLYLQAGGKLSLTAPKEGGDSFDEYISDPAKPVPFMNGIAVGMTVEHMLDDQRFAASRPDVLVYQTEPLEQDMTFAGPVRPELFVSTSGTDSDWIVKLIDVFPDDYETVEPDVRGRNTPRKTPMNGYQMMVRGEVMRGKFRNSYSTPEAFAPGKATSVAYDMNDINHTFRRGHRIMVQIQSSWFPLVDRNPQKFLDINSAKESDFVKATQRIYHGGDKATRIKVMMK